MSQDPKNRENCPSCGKDLRAMLVDDAIPDFCLKCRFPLMLIANKYRLIRKFDEGGFAIIYEAEHIHLTRDPKRVIKVIKPEFLTNESLTSRFFREVQVTSALSQRNNHIVRIYDDFGEVPNLGYFYVMEFLEGQPLNDVLDNVDGLLPLDLCYRLFLQLCDAMQAAHLEQIVHRDLKPHNLFIIQQGRESHFLKVIDFGIAKPVGQQRKATQVTQGILGTPAYMAPEQCINKDIGEATDIYAMGCILYELLTGETPFVPRDPAEQEKISVMEIMSAHLNQPPAPMHTKLKPGRTIPPALEQVVQKALAKKAADRYASVEEFEQAFLYALPDATRPGSYLSTGVGFGEPSVAQDRLDDFPHFSNTNNGSFQVELRHPSHTPAPRPGIRASGAILPDLFSLPEDGFGDFILEENNPDGGDLVIKPVLPERPGYVASPNQARVDTQPPSRGAVRRVIEINRKGSEGQERTPPPATRPSSRSPQPASFTTPSSHPISTDLHIQLPNSKSLSSGMNTPRPSSSGSSSRRPRNQIVFNGRPGVGRSPLKQPERSSLLMPLLLLVLVMFGAFVVVQTFYSHLFPWGQIFPWGQPPKPHTHQPHERRSSTHIRSSSQTRWSYKMKTVRRIRVHAIRSTLHRLS